MYSSINQKNLLALKEDKHQLQLELAKHKTISQETLARSAERVPPSSSPLCSQRQNPFKSYRINPIALESVKLKSDLAANGQLMPLPILKRDVAVMTIDKSPTTRSIGISTNHIQYRSMATHTEHKMYSKAELQAAIDMTIEKQLRDIEQSRKAISKISVGTQMAQILEPSSSAKNYKSTQQQTDTIRVSDCSIQSSIEQRSVGSCTVDLPIISCQKCSIVQRSVASGPNESFSNSSDHVKISLQSLNSNASHISLAPIEKTNVSSQTVSPICHSKSTQHEQIQNLKKNRQTDTVGLIIRKNQSVGTIAPSSSSSLGTQYDQPRPLMVTRECNTAAAPMTRDQSCQDVVNVRSVECGADKAMVQPLDENHHILISCSDNYCDSCKDTIKGLANAFGTRQVAIGTASTSSVPASGPSIPEYSRIPRPLTLASPRSERKFMRQNTYTMSSSGGSALSTPGIEERTLEFPVER